MIGEWYLLNHLIINRFIIFILFLYNRCIFILYIILGVPLIGLIDKTGPALAVYRIPVALYKVTAHTFIQERVGTSVLSVIYYLELGVQSHL